LNVRIGIPCIRVAEQLGHVERACIVARALEGAVDLIGIETVRAQLLFDVAAERLARCREMPGDTRFVFTEQPSGLGERQSLRVVVAEAQTVPGIEPVDRCSQRGMDERDQPALVRIRYVRGRGGRLLLRQRRLPPGGTHPIDVPLGQHRAEPGGQAASAVEIAEERTPFTAARAKSV
jgi:hypothetical protein